MLELQSRHRTEHPGPKNHTSSCGVYMFLSGTGLCGQLIEALHDTWQFLGGFFYVLKMRVRQKMVPFTIYKFIYK